jgi:hypothetical protein
MRKELRKIQPVLSRFDTAGKGLVVRPSTASPEKIRIEGYILPKLTRINQS